MQKIINHVIPQHGQAILADIYFKEKHNKHLILFCHGFKGFKDWGAWHLVAQQFAEAGFVFVKMNFSHNGIGLENTTAFTRLDLFYENNYSKELDDVQVVLNHIQTDAFWQDFDIEQISLIGHSRGGGIALQSAYELPVISKVITWASISTFNRFGSVLEIENWKEIGYKNFYNSRTQQDMKIGFQFYEDYIKNINRLDLEKTVKQLQKPQLIIHGTADEAVGFSHAQRLKQWNPQAELHLIDNANHVFGAKHPYIENKLPLDLQKVVDLSLEWLFA